MQEDYAEMYASFREQMYEKFDDEVDPEISYEDNINNFLQEIYDSYDEIEEELRSQMDYIRRYSRSFDDEEMEEMEDNIIELRIQLKIIDDFIRELKLQIPPKMALSSR
jgi:predicted  nucleic acid-binding Zn-ribbon protein